MASPRPDLEARLISSYATVTGRDLIADAGANGSLYDAPAVLLMHGSQPDPVFCYANRTAQTLWGYAWDEFTTLPSRLSAEPMARAERERLLREARERGFIADYQGIRIAKDGRRFAIRGVTLWNVICDGACLGQAAVIQESTPIPGSAAAESGAGL